MEKYLHIFDEFVLLFKNHGIDAAFWIFVLIYAASLIFPEIAHDFIVSNNVIVFGIVYLTVKYFNRNIEKKEDFQEVSKIRNEASSNVRVELSRLLAETNADRAYVLEFHNGKQNATNMSFTYLDMTHEECMKGITYMSENCQNMSTTLYPITTHMLEHHNFVGTLEDLEKIDPKIAHRMSVNELKYMGFILLRSKGIDIGMLCVAYEKHEPISDTDLISTLSIYAQDISDYLDLRKYKK